MVQGRSFLQRVRIGCTEKNLLYFGNVLHKLLATKLIKFLANNNNNM